MLLCKHLIVSNQHHRRLFYKQESLSKACMPCSYYTEYNANTAVVPLLGVPEPKWPNFQEPQVLADLSAVQLKISVSNGRAAEFAQ